MKQTILYLCKGLFFSSLILLLAVLFLAFVMMQTGWNGAFLFPLLLLCFCLSVFFGGKYFAVHAASRRFLWGIGFGFTCFTLYLFLSLLCSSEDMQLPVHTLPFLFSSLGSGCLGGMLS